MAGGKLTVPTEFFFSRVSSGGKSSLNLTGGELTTPDPKWAHGGGTLSSTITMNLLGGVWRVPSIGGGYVRQIYGNGGTIQATGASTTNGVAEGVIATYTGEAPDVASWTLTGLGGHRSIPTIRAEEGNIYLTLEKMPGGTMIILK